MTSNKIASLLRSEILTQKYEPRDRLPSERQLANQFHVARGTIREALTRLEEEGIVETRAGSGTYVTHSESADTMPVIQSTSPLELIDARFAIEPQIVKLAVLNATPHDITVLQRTLSGLDAVRLNDETFSEIDEHFHSALAKCSHNSLIIWMHTQIIEIREHKQWKKMKRLTLTTQSIEAYNQHHLQILQAVQQRDVEQAIHCMRKHLHYARTALTQVSNTTP